MMLDDTIAAATDELAVQPWREKRIGAARKVASLVLFVGAGCRPSPSECESLAREGMRCLWLPGPAQACAAARAARFDAVVVDASMLSDRGGATLARLRTELRCPILVVADRNHDEIDEILALELGADAYLQRPVAPRRLRAHLSVLIRRRVIDSGDEPDAQHPPASEVDRPTTQWSVDRVGNQLRRGDTRVALTEVQCAFLQCLFEAEGRIVPRARLAAALPNGHAVHARSVDVYVHRLRKRLHEAGVFDLLIEAIRGRGYLLRTQG